MRQIGEAEVWHVRQIGEVNCFDVGVYVFVCVYMCVSVCKCVHVCVGEYVCTCVCIYVYVFACVYMCDTCGRLGGGVTRVSDWRGEV